METICPTCGATTYFPKVEGQHILACACGASGTVGVSYSFVFGNYFSFPKWGQTKETT